MEAGDIINSGSHAQIYLDNDGNSERPIKAVQASGKYFGKNNPKNSTILPEYVDYKSVWAQPYRWNFLNQVPSTNTDANKIKLARELWGN